MVDRLEYTDTHVIIPTNPVELNAAYQRILQDSPGTHHSQNVPSNRWTHAQVDTLSPTDQDRLFVLTTGNGKHPICGIVINPKQKPRIISFNHNLDATKGIIEINTDEEIPLGRYMNNGDFPSFFPLEASANHFSIQVGQTGNPGETLLSILDGHTKNPSTNGTKIIAVQNTDVLKRFGPEFPSERSQTLNDGAEGRINSQKKRFQAATYQAGGIWKGYLSNEDAVAIIPAQGTAIACDGMGHGGQGRPSAKAVIEGVVAGIEAGEGWNRVLDRGVNNLKANPNLRGNNNAGATLAYTHKVRTNQDGTTNVESLVVGDAKNYIIEFDPMQGWQFLYVSKDQSMTQFLIDRGNMTDLEGYSHIDRNLTLNCILANGYQKPNIKNLRCKPGTICLSVTDGVSDLVSPEDILDLVKCYGYNLTPDIIKDFAFQRQEYAHTNDKFPIKIGGKHETVNKKNAYDNIAVAIQIT